MSNVAREAGSFSSQKAPNKRIKEMRYEDSFSEAPPNGELVDSRDDEFERDLNESLSGSEVVQKETRREQQVRPKFNRELKRSWSKEDKAASGNKT